MFRKMSMLEWTNYVKPDNQQLFTSPKGTQGTLPSLKYEKGDTADIIQKLVVSILGIKLMGEESAVIDLGYLV